MSQSLASPLKRCFISAPVGYDLGALPDVLSERAISWEWAKEAPGRLLNSFEAVSASDFLIGIFGGLRSDDRVFYETGLAVGLGKPTFLIVNRRILPFDLVNSPQRRFLLRTVTRSLFT